MRLRLHPLTIAIRAALDFERWLYAQSRE